MFLIIFSSLIADLEFSRTTYDYSNGLLNPIIESHSEQVHVEFIDFEDRFEYFMKRDDGSKTKLVCPQEHYAAFVISGDIHESCEGYHLIDDLEAQETGYGFPYSLIPFDSESEYEDASFPFSQLKDAAMSFSNPELIKGSVLEGEERIFSSRIDLAEESEDGFWKWNIRGEVITSSHGFPILGSRVFTKMNPMNHSGLFVIQDTSVTLKGFDSLSFNESMYLNPVLKLETNYGNYFIELFFDKAPRTSQNFLKLSRYGFFDGTICHRIILGFVNQCGDSTGTGWGGPGYEFDNEVHPDLKHVPYVLSMANAGPNTNGSQWFIPIEDTERVRKLDGNYSVFGRVVSGFEVVDVINSVKVDKENNHRPVEPVIIKKVSEIFPWLGFSPDLEDKGSPVDFLDNFLIDGDVQIAQIGNVNLKDIKVNVQKELYGNSFEVSGFVVLKIIVGENVTNHYFLIDESGDLVMAIDLMGKRYESVGFYENGIWNFSFTDLGFDWQIWIVPKKEMYFSVKDSNNVFSWGMVRYVNE